MTLAEALDHYRLHHPTLSSGACGQYAISIRLLAKHTLKTDLSELSDDAIAMLANRLLASGRSPVTVNGRVANLLTLWRWAYKKKLCQNAPCEWDRLSVPKRLPKAWSPDEMTALLAACDAAPMRRTWGPDHWRALVLTVYDTSLRIGCLLNVPRDHLDANGWLSIPADLQKGKAETAQPLHPQTLHAIAQLPMRDKLFPWPFHRRHLWNLFRSDVLTPAGLPCGRRDLFHKLRRTSYTWIDAKLGTKAASQHAAHTCDLSTVYSDPILKSKIAPQASALDVLPRPGLKAKEPQPASIQLAKILESMNADAAAALLLIAQRLTG